jgi:hypothetical protein
MVLRAFRRSADRLDGIDGAYSIRSRWLSCDLPNWAEFWSELGEFSKVLGGGGKEEFVTGAAWASQAKPAKPQDPLQMSEQHLHHLLAIAPGCVAGISFGDRTRHVSCPFMDRAEDNAHRCFRTASGFERAA